MGNRLYFYQRILIYTYLWACLFLVAVGLEGILNTTKALDVCTLLSGVFPIANEFIILIRGVLKNEANSYY